MCTCNVYFPTDESDPCEPIVYKEECGRGRRVYLSGQEGGEPEAPAREGKEIVVSDVAEVEVEAKEKERVEVPEVTFDPQSAQQKEKIAERIPGWT